MKADQEIVANVKNGKKHEFSELVSRHQRSMMRLAVRMTRDIEAAEDIVQDSFIKAYQKINMFEGRSSFKSWLYQITLNTARNKLRGRRMEPLDKQHLDLAVDPDAESNLAQEDIRKIIQSEVEKLPMKQRTALSLRIYDDLSFKEIAEIMDCPYDTAKANYRHALLKLRHTFQGNVFLKTRNFDEGLMNMGARRRFAEVE